jgi:hypothetical protein
MRRFLSTALFALVAVAPFSVQAAPLPAAAVVAVQPTQLADLVLLDHGFNAGLRQGLVCRVTRGTTEIAEVLLVDLRPTCSVALILSVASAQAIRAGDLAPSKFSNPNLD